MKAAIRPFLTLSLLIGFLSIAPAALNLSTTEAASYRSKLLQLHNRERKKRNLPRFRRVGSLNRAAAKYARVMKVNNHFSHTGPDGSRFDQRIRAAGYRGNAMGENIAFGYRTPAAVFRGWMKSPGHRRNIRSRKFDEIGFGKSGTYWVTNFGG